MTILDGRDGRPLLDPYPRDSVGAQTSPLTLSAEGRGNDLFLYWIADCTGHKGDGGQFGFRKGNCRAMITSVVCYSNTVTMLAFLFKKYLWLSHYSGLSLVFCSHLTPAFVSTSTSKFNIASIVMQTQMQRMSLNPFFTSTFALLLTQC